MLDFLTKNSVDAAAACGLLGIALNAKPEQIQQAYIFKMRQYHPDLGGNEYLAAQINWARDVLLSK